MTCYLIHDEDGNHIGFMCSRSLKDPPCSDCGDVTDVICDYPVGDDKTCDRRLCGRCAHEVGPDLHYCHTHFKEWEEFRALGGVKKVLENVVPFRKA